METYKHILVAVDFFDEAHLVTDKAKMMADKHNAKLSLIHVVDNMPLPDHSYGLDVSLEVDLTSDMMANAKARLTKLATELGIMADSIWVELGNPKLEINRVAEVNKVDLIVVGSHGRHGLALLLGSTSTGVLHYAACDVLAVRLKDA